MSGREESIAAKVSSETKQRIRIAAAKQGVSMSEYIRQAVMDRLESDEAAEGNRTPATATAD
jgi:predicted HicB family RNase H-like nuclease